ncbi:hypothetical protein [Pseudomonas sp. DP16D-R1]|jgi:hypothetical protein|uniref:hypothetical protein n=1 Tax=Pseudomonas sp. DP16D-R1 TaxID=2075551 RepID=UPI000CD27C93|nr:hypothetical protein [Pseudomonas sp. DP16D-R1]POA78371.1 hypothetical protein C1890_10760 [Pseudomonas sp. DP16D-R1]
MTKLKKRITNPMTVIAIFATLSETSAAISLPFLDNKEREIYIWFLISFPFYLLLLFFVTLNFNYRSLYAPSDFDKGKHFIKVLDKSKHPENSHSTTSSEHTERHKPVDAGRSASPPCAAQASLVDPGLQGLPSVEHHIRMTTLLKELCIIDARCLSKKIEFSALLENIERPRDRQAHVILFLTCAESEAILKNCAIKHSKLTRKRHSATCCAAYNLNTHEVTVIDHSGQSISETRGKYQRETDSR